MLRDHPQFKLRLPPELKAFLEEEARRNERSVSAEIVHRLQATVDSTRILNRIGEGQGDEELVNALNALRHQVLVCADVIELIKGKLNIRQGNIDQD